ncbi:MAG: TetM/TetW/TetO/TetS family tetracycline resistance ribosomal protection protein, partial [Clostridia bacterium]|nr:TetM/TetW/TetO/TetS family tetracycline resistance ribosomal protection protein [Clostridia bacterium]
CIGMLAHVDAGKTTLSEGLLYAGGALRKLGRVDHGDAFLDTDVLERERGITIFSKQAILPLPEVEITLMDTPGHVDFSAEMERTLQVLDYAVLVISGTDGVQSHTETLWRLLRRYQIPTFVFINKMDLAGADKPVILAELQKRLSDKCIDMDAPEDARLEAFSLCDERLLERYLEEGTLTQADLARVIARRKAFPCRFGSALKLEGVEQLLEDLSKLTRTPEYPADFAARVYKIARDTQGTRLTYLKVTGGQLRVKSLLSGKDGRGEWSEKADQLRLYSGAKYKQAEVVEAGSVCAVTGLERTFPGQGLGHEALAQPPLLEPVLTYRLLLPQDCNLPETMRKLRQLEEEDPQLHILWDERLREVQVQLMGEVQLEVLQRQIKERFAMDVSFGQGSVVYKETIAAPVEGVGHFEPLRHYAEVHLLLEPGPRGSGLVFDSLCSTDALDLNWQRLILTHLEEKQHLGVLTGSPITDLRISILSGRAHVKHTEGGDFRQATYRALRQGLRKAESILLEPYYDFSMELPVECVGRAMTDIQQKNGTCNSPEQVGDRDLLTGSAPVAAMRGYQSELASYTRGRGRLSCWPGRYEVCAQQQAVVEAMAYDPDADVENSADSVFCSHGAGVIVPWYEVEQHMHLESGLRPAARVEEPAPVVAAPAAASAYRGTLEEDKELQAIYERTYGAVKRREFIQRTPEVRTESHRQVKHTPVALLPEYLLVDGYNIIFAWDELKALAAESLEAARQSLADLLSNYQGYRKCGVILVFDAYKVKGNPGSVEKYKNIHIVYTKEAETADAFIEKATYDMRKQYRVRVATSDGMEQLIILGHGATRVPANIFLSEIRNTNLEITEIVQKYRNRAMKGSTVREMTKKK